MNYASLISKLQVLLEGKQLEVLAFVEYLADRFARTAPPGLSEWSEREFSELAMTQAMRGLENEPVLYTEADVNERWL